MSIRSLFTISQKIVNLSKLYFVYIPIITFGHVFLFIPNVQGTFFSLIMLHQLVDVGQGTAVDLELSTRVARYHE